MDATEDGREGVLCVRSNHLRGSPTLHRKVIFLLGTTTADGLSAFRRSQSDAFEHLCRGYAPLAFGIVIKSLPQLCV